MKTNSQDIKHYAVTIFGVAVGLIIGVILIDTNLLPDEADAQVYVASSLLFGSLAYLINNAFSKK